MSGHGPLEIRDALLRAWILSQTKGQPRALLLNLYRQAAYLYLPSSQARVLLLPLDTERENPLEDLEARIIGAIEGIRWRFGGQASQILHVVLLGGDASLKRALAYTPMSRELRHSITFHQIDEMLEVWDETSPLPPLTQARPVLAALIPHAIPANHAPGDPVGAHLPPLTPAQLETVRAGDERILNDQALMSEIFRRPARASWVLGGVVAVMFLLELAFGRGTTQSLVMQWLMGAMNGLMVQHGDWWRLMSAAFLHSGFLHFFFNGFVLYQLGPFLERLVGPRRILVLYGAAALGGSLASMWANPATNEVGASGALWGLMTAGALIAWQPQGLLPESVAPQLKRSLLQALGLNLLISLAPGIAMSAHLGGGLAGVVLTGGWLLSRRARGITGPADPLPEPEMDYTARLRANMGGRSVPGSAGSGGIHRAEGWALTLMAVGMSGFMAASIGAALWYGQPWQLLRPPEVVRQTLPGTPVSIELPRSLAGSPEIVEDQVRTFTFGYPGRTPALFEAWTFKLEEAPPADQVQDLLTEFAEKASLPRPFKFETLGGTTTLVQSEGGDDRASSRRWLTIRGNWLIKLEVTEFPGLPDDWRKSLEGLINTLKVE